MKVFLSWSGTLSHKVAITLRDWLPSVLQYVDPYVSSEDIDKGARWSTDIAKELEASAYGIVVVTRSNMNAPWIAFESGALSKALDKSRVSPLLFGVKRSEVQGPLLQFQSTVVEKQDIKKLLVSINKAVDADERLEPARLARVFDVWWPELESAFSGIVEAGEARPATSQKKEESTANDILEELLELVRSQQKILTSPDQILPPDYLEYVFSRGESVGHLPISHTAKVPKDAVEFLIEQVGELRALREAVAGKKQPCFSTSEFDSFESLMSRLIDVSEFLARRARIKGRQLDLLKGP